MSVNSKAVRIEQFDTNSRSRGAAATKAAMSGRKRVSHPATTETIYTDEEAEFLRAIQAYQARAGRHHLAFTEVFAIAREVLGVALVS